MRQGRACTKGRQGVAKSAKKKISLGEQGLPDEALQIVTFALLLPAGTAALFDAQQPAATGATTSGDSCGVEGLCSDIRVRRYLSALDGINGALCE